jgi:uncharacterized protein YjbI with pentapeptide repeats
MGYTNFCSAHLSCVTFDNCALDENKFPEAVLSNVSFVNCGGFMVNLFLHEATLEQVTFRSCTIDGCNFMGAHLFEVTFEQTQMYGSGFIGAQLTNVAFRSAGVNDSEFNGAKLLNIVGVLSRFRGVEMEYAKMKNASFTSCLFHKAAFEDAGFTDVVFDKCFFDPDTSWPEDFRIPVKQRPIPDTPSELI